jgi:hypothetical protein
MMMRVNAVVMMILMTATITFGCASHRTVDPSPPPPTRDQMKGIWFGLFSYVGYRLDLDADGSGTLATARLPDVNLLTRYWTDNWELDGNVLSATFHPIDGKQEPIYLQGHTTSYGAIRNISISIAATVRVPIEGEFTQESRIREWLTVLGTPAAVREE